jgi:hypothetical protein
MSGTTRETSRCAPRSGTAFVQRTARQAPPPDSVASHHLDARRTSRRYGHIRDKLGTEPLPPTCRSAALPKASTRRRGGGRKRPDRRWCRGPPLLRRQIRMARRTGLAASGLGRRRAQNAHHGPSNNCCEKMSARHVLYRRVDALVLAATNAGCVALRTSRQAVRSPRFSVTPAKNAGSSALSQVLGPAAGPGIKRTEGRTEVGSEGGEFPLLAVALHEAGVLQVAKSFVEHA